MDLLSEVTESLRSRNFDKLKEIKEQLLKNLEETPFLEAEEDFFNLIGTGPFQLNRDQVAETSFAPDHCKRNNHHLNAVR